MRFFVARVFPISTF